MRIRSLVREAWAMIVGSAVASALCSLVVGAVCLACLTTVGSSAATAAEVAARLDDAGSRRLHVVDTKGQGFINETTLTVVRGLSAVTSAVALSRPVDVTNTATGRGGPRVAAWSVIGGPSGSVDLVRGRWPRPGEAIVSLSAQQRLGMDEPVGSLDAPEGRQVPVVGAYRVRAGYDALASGVLVAAAPGTGAQELHAVLADVNDAEQAVSAVLATLAPADPQGVQVESPVGLAATARGIAASLEARGRLLLGSIMTGGAALVLAVTAADTQLRRRDLGRRRTLGASRGVLVALVVIRVLMLATIGALLGTATGAVLRPVPPSFALGVAYLSVLVASLAAIPPALAASLRDPVRVMRLP